MNIQGIPDALPENLENNEKALQALHSLLFEIELMDGELICENCHRVYEVSNSIANMILREDELEEKKVKKDKESDPNAKPKKNSKKKRTKKPQKEGMDVEENENEDDNENENEMEEDDDQEEEEKKEN